MKRTYSHLQRHARRWVAAILVSCLYLAARLPDVSTEERQHLARQFKMEPVALPVPPGPDVRSIRPVHPSLSHIAAWISSVGAAIALNDLDGDGLSNDVCYVDVRTDQAIVVPAPGTGDRFAPFSLDAGTAFDRRTMAPMGCLPGDMNEDGRMDLLVYYWGRTPLAFMREASAPMKYAVVEVVPGNERWYTNAAVFADADGDGHADLIVGNYFADGARILDALAGGAEQMQHSMSRAFNAGGDRLLLWQPQTAEVHSPFRQVAGVFPTGTDRGWTLAIGAADLDGDLLPEIYFANDFGPDRLMHNRSTPGKPSFVIAEGRKRLRDPSSKVLGRDSFKGMGIDFADLNSDGWPDFIVSNIAANYALEESHFLWLSTNKPEQLRQGRAPYVDAGEELGLSRSGWGWDARMVDLNNDGSLEILQALGFVRGETNRWPELHEVAMANDQFLQDPRTWHFVRPGDDLSGHSHTPFYARASDGRFYDIAPEAGLSREQVSRGISIADVDRDGRLDYAIANQWDDSFFYRNRSSKVGAFLGLQVRHQNGRPAIGAMVRVRTPQGKTMSAQVDGGSGHSGKRSNEVHFGLGGGTDSLGVEVHWRDAQGVHVKSWTLLPGWHVLTIGG